MEEKIVDIDDDDDGKRETRTNEQTNSYLLHAYWTVSNANDTK